MLPIRLVPGDGGAWTGGEDLVLLQGCVAGAFSKGATDLWGAVGVGKVSGWLGHEDAGGGKAAAALLSALLLCLSQRAGKQLGGCCWG